MQPTEFHALLSALTAMPAALTAVINKITIDATARPAPESFSLLETVCHLRDIEQEGYLVRIGKLINEVNPWLADINGAQLAKERDYQHDNLAGALQAFIAARAQSVQLLTALPLEKLQNAGEFENTGTITLEKLIAMMAEHDRDHLDELRALI
jgi:hypothetical protein